MKIKNNLPTLKEESHYFYQIQGQLHVTGRNICYFFIYTPKWNHLEIIKYDEEFWSSKMESSLKL